MTNKIKFSHKIMAVFLTLTFLPSILPINYVYASNNGPTSPEATAFEPVDATDMVNLATGDLSYVLPLLNVPSPEGGYPLALSYHAGIAMDQEASWVGLGWNLNPGAINRFVNGYPDDYNSSLLSEYFYDEGGTSTIYSVSTGYSTPGGGLSVGLGLSWGSNLSLGGTISIGYGASSGNFNSGVNASYGRNSSIGLNAGIATQGGLTVGAATSSNNGLTGSLGFNSNSDGFNVSRNTKGETSFAFATESRGGNLNSVGFNLSSNGVGITTSSRNLTGNNVYRGAGTGFQFSFNNNIEMGNYTTIASSFNIPISVPTAYGTFSLSFGKQKFRYFLGDTKKNYVNGPIFFNNGTYNAISYSIICSKPVYQNSPEDCLDLDDPCYPTYDPFRREICFSEIAYSQSERDQLISQNEVGDCECDYSTLTDEAFMDINELPLEFNFFGSDLDVAQNNIALPNYDSYNVLAQGLSGSMSSRLYENGALFGLSNNVNEKEFELKYAFNGSNQSLPDHAKFTSRPDFYLQNEVSTYIGVTEANFDTSSAKNSIIDYYTQTNGVSDVAIRRKTSNYVEYYTNREIRENYESIKYDGFLRPEVSGFDRRKKPLDGIGAFKITAVDGKTYHYSLPVYNHETITRTFGLVKNDDGYPKGEPDSYLEKRQLDPFATHWLLTAVTGPDYLDKNANGVADKGDYGYWTSFEYGKWSEAFAWKNPYGKNFFANSEDPTIKTWIKGRKELYYLDRVKTRTHSALFVKEEREDGQSNNWYYNSVSHTDNTNQDSNDYIERFLIPAQKQMRLKEILLIKDDDDVVNKNHGIDLAQSVTIEFNDSEKGSDEIDYQLNHNVLDKNDNIFDIKNKTIKKIEFAYDHSLARGTPNAPTNFGRSTLLSVHFGGKKGIQLIPPYKFEYINPFYEFDIDDKNEFGYLKNGVGIWSLNKIVTPQGGELNLAYEKNSFKSLVSKVEFVSEGNHTVEFLDANYNEGKIVVNNLSNTDYGMAIGQKVDIQSIRTTCDRTGFAGAYRYTYEGQGTIDADLGNGSYVVAPDGPQEVVELWQPQNPELPPCSVFSKESLKAVYIPAFSQVYQNLGGIRTKSISVTDGLNSYKTTYEYGEGGNGVGYISYLPFDSEYTLELPYSSELPPPRVMYDEVSVESTVANKPALSKTVYKFNVLKDRSPNDIKFQDFYEIDIDESTNLIDNSNNDVSVSKYTIHDNLATLGQLLEVKVLNKESQVLSKIVNEYYTPGTTPNSVGISKESYQSYKMAKYSNQNDKWSVNTSTRIEYPSILKSTTDYRNGFKFTTEFDNLDPITGQAQLIRSFSSNGDEWNVVSIPAHIKYPQMGSKVDNNSNLNMLNQIAVEKTFSVENGNQSLISAGITTWKPEEYGITDFVGEYPNEITLTRYQNVWRKHKTFIWNGNTDNQGLFLNYDDVTDDDFDWSLENNDLDVLQPVQWKQLSETTKYNEYSHPIEVMDVNENYASSKMNYGKSKFLMIGNGSYDQIFFSGAEDLSSNGSLFGGGVSKGTASISTTAHTGSSALELNANETAFQVSVDNRNKGTVAFKISVWANTLNNGYENVRVNVGGQVIEYRDDEKVRAGEWMLLNFYSPITDSKTVYVTTEGGSAIVDDFRIHPTASSITSYIYNDWGELTHILGSNNMGVQYEYDEAGRLIKTLTEVEDFAGPDSGGFIPVSENEYTYKYQ